MRYILLDINYDNGSAGQLIISYNIRTCEAKYIFHDAQYSRNIKDEPIFDLLDINAGLIKYASAFTATFEQTMGLLEECCKQRFFNNIHVKYTVREVPKSKVFELML